MCVYKNCQEYLRNTLHPTFDSVININWYSWSFDQLSNNGDYIVFLQFFFFEYLAAFNSLDGYNFSSPDMCKQFIFMKYLIQLLVALLKQRSSRRCVSHRSLNGAVHCAHCLCMAGHGQVRSNQTFFVHLCYRAHLNFWSELFVSDTGFTGYRLYLNRKLI